MSAARPSGAEIRAAAKERGHETHLAIARALGIPEGVLLAALGENAAEVRTVDHARQGDLGVALCSWGRLRVVIRNRHAVAELLVDLGGARADAGGVLTVNEAHLEGHLPLGKAAAAYFIERPGHGGGHSRSVAFVDDEGEVMVKIFLLKHREDADYPAVQIASFERERDRLCSPIR